MGVGQANARRVWGVCGTGSSPVPLACGERRSGVGGSWGQRRGQTRQSLSGQGEDFGLLSKGRKALGFKMGE